MSESDKSSSESSESEEEESEEEEVVNKRSRTDGGRKRTAKRARTAAAFFEEEVEEANSESEEEEEEDGFKDATPAEVSKHEREIQKRYEARMHANESFNKKSAEDIASEIEKRHRVSTEARWAGAQDLDVDISRNSSLPTLDDPKLYCIKCKPGEERLLVVRVMNKYLALKQEGSQPQIFSCVSPGTKGFIYVEARSQSHVMNALRGLRGVFFSKVSLVPFGQMTAVMNISTSKQTLKSGDFVRLRGYPYRGDLAKVYHVLESGTRVVVQCVPRIDFALFSMSEEERKDRRKERVVPPKKFFNSEEVANAGGRPGRQPYPHTGKVIDFLDNSFFENGYLLKEFNTSYIQTKNVSPTVEELQSFRLGRAIGEDEEEDAEAALADGALLDQLGRSFGNQGAASTFSKGDVVVVREGELQHLKGQVLSVEDDGKSIKIQPIHDEIRDQTLEFPASQLNKYFQVGNHVKVLGGRYAGETGTVVKIEELGEKWKAILFADSSLKEVQVFVDDLKISEEISSGKDTLSGYAMFDVVVLGQGQVGIITKVGNDSFKVVLQSNAVKSIRLTDIRNKVNPKRVGTALDKLKNSVKVNEVVRVVTGEHTGLEGTVKHIHRSLLFLHSRQRIQNSGVFVERARNCQLSGETFQKSNGLPGGGSMGGMGGRGGFGGRGRGRGRGRGVSRDTLPGKSVKIKQGRFKGYVGIVTSATPDIARVEIHSKNKTISIERNKVFVVGDINGEQRQAAIQTPSHVMIGNVGAPSRVRYESLSTPMHAPGTPMAYQESSANAWDPKAALPASIATPSLSSGFTEPAEPPTPAGFGVASSTPYAVPPTPATPSTPAGTLATPAAFGSSSSADNPGGLKEGDKIVVTSGEFKGKFGKLQGIDESEAIVVLDNDGAELLKIITLGDISKA